MDIDDEPKILLCGNFDQFIYNYHDSLNILIVKNEDKLKSEIPPKSSIKHYFQPSIPYTTINISKQSFNTRSCYLNNDFTNKNIVK